MNKVKKPDKDESPEPKKENNKELPKQEPEYRHITKHMN